MNEDCRNARVNLESRRKCGLPPFFVRFFASIFVLYMVLLILSFVLSMYFVSENNGMLIRKAMHSASCEQYAYVKKSSRLNVFEFYLNTKYWLAEYRAYESILYNEKCFKIIRDELTRANGSASIAIVSKSGKTVSVVRN